MSLPLLAAIGLPLFLAPWTTHRIYEQVERRRLAAIAVDNAGILMGRAGRKVLEEWRGTAKALDAAELAHHVVHLCARSPGPQAAACAAEDQAWEVAWEARLRLLEAQTWASWTGAGGAGKREGVRLGIELGLEGFSAGPPVARRPCPLCSGRFRIEWLEPPVARWEALGVSELSEVRWFRSAETGKWNYRMQIPGVGW